MTWPSARLLPAGRADETSRGPSRMARQCREETMTHVCYCVTKHHAPLERIDCPTPEPKGAEVLLRVTATGVCHSDIHIWEGVYDLGSGDKLALKDRGISLPLT